MSQAVRFIVLSFFALAGCARPVMLRIVDNDGFYRPVPAATVSRVDVSTFIISGAEVQDTDADGRVNFTNNTERFVIAKPGYATVTLSTRHLTEMLQVGISRTQPTAAPATVGE